VSSAAQQRAFISSSSKWLRTTAKKTLVLAGLIRKSMPGALQGEGLFEGLDWLSGTLKTRHR
jgi:hypothetical protein